MITYRRNLGLARRPGPFRVSAAARALFQNISQAMSDGLLVLDRRGRVRLANPALGQILGLDPQAMLGRAWAELFFDGRSENDAFHDLILEVIQNQASHHNRQVTYHPPQGPPRELIITTNLLLEQGAPIRAEVGMLAMFKDVTEIKQLHRREQELLIKSRGLYQQKLEGLERMARAVAHEIRNPVMSIGGLSLRLLSKCGPGEAQVDYLKRIIDGSRRLEQIVAQVQSYAALPAPKPERLPLSPWLAAQVEPYLPRAQAQGVRLSLPPAGGDLAGLTVLADPKLLARLLGVLLDNALEAMPQGGELRLDLVREPQEGRALLEVHDSGRGIAPEDLPYVFDPFFTTKADGVGMNLAIAKRIAEEQSAQLSAESPPGQGASFRLELPLA